MVKLIGSRTVKKILTNVAGIRRLTMRKQENLIHSVNWDYLIILDACRCDYFEEECKIHGEYQRVWSPASCTVDWLKSMFSSFYPYTFYSSTPFVNSKMPIKNYNGRKHFIKIIDLWDWGWSDELCTVPPSVVYESAREAESKSIIWFMQPHLPAIGKIKLVPKWFKENFTRGQGGDIVIIEQVMRGELSPETVKEAYRENLKLVLEYVSKLINELEGTIIITSDHGEYLGEMGFWSHPPNINDPILRAVPYLRLTVK